MCHNFIDNPRHINIISYKKERMGLGLNLFKPKNVQILIN